MNKRWTYTKLYLSVFSEPDYSGAKIPDLTQKNFKVKESILERENPYDIGNSLYIHIPFCIKKCNYCRWSTTLYGEEKSNQYVDAVCKEADMIKNTPYSKSTRFDTVYFGGGTPSTLTYQQIEKVFKKITSTFQLKNTAEISFEANPSSLTKEKLAVLTDYNVSRISLGTQTFDEKLLETMNCTHNMEQTKRAIALVKSSKCALNLDLLYGHPEQTLPMWKMDLEKICQFDPEQISLYPLRIFPGTILYRNLKRADQFDPDEHEKHLASFNDIGHETLFGSGYERSEFPFNYKKAGQPKLTYLPIESRVINIGAGAGGFYDNGESMNIKYMKGYVESINKNRFAIQAELPLDERLVHERFLFQRIVFGDKTIPSFDELTAKRFKSFYGTDIDEQLYSAVKSEMMKYELIAMKDGVMHNTTRLWSYIDNAIIMY
jgi:oxygen-independent coproporphyrinogen III oxidase